jgi:MFS family permease
VSSAGPSGTPARHAEVATVFGAALLQGVSVGSLPALAAILTSPDWYGFSPTFYGLLFVPLALAAISAALSEATLLRRIGLKPIILVGLAFNLVGMALILGSQLAIGEGIVAAVMLLAAAGSVGAGFGLTTPSLMTLAAGFFPARRDRAVLVEVGVPAGQGDGGLGGARRPGHPGVGQLSTQRCPEEVVVGRSA